MALLFGLGYLVVFLTALVPIHEPDFWWHLASGRYILTHHAIPTTDPFSWTAKGTPWVDTYWAYDALMGLGFNRIGITGLVVVHALLVLGIFFLFDRRLQQRGVFWGWRMAAWLVLLQGGGPAGGYWGAESSLVSLLFFSGLVWHWDFLQKHRRHGSVWLWPVLFALWANLHRGFIIGLGVAAVLLLEESFQSRRWRTNSLWFLSCLVATWGTPYGAGLFRMIWDDFTLSSQWIMGWEQPPFSHLRLYYLTLLCFAGLAVVRAKQKDGWGPAPLVVALLLAFESARHGVFIPYFMVFALPWMAAQAAQVRLSWSPATRLWTERLAIVGFTMVLTDLAFARFPRTLQFEGTPSGVFLFIRETKIIGPFYNDYGFGGYWIWAFDGNPPVFMDGRYPAVEGYKSVMKDILQGQKGPSEWRSFLKNYGIEASVVKFRDPGPLDSMFRAMFPREDWALVYWDDEAALFLHRGKNDGLIKKAELSRLWPDITRPAFIQQIRSMSFTNRKLLAGELVRNYASHPSSRRMQAMMTVFLEHQRDGMTSTARSSKGADTP